MIEDWYSLDTIPLEEKLDTIPLEKKLEEKLSALETSYNDLKAVSLDLASRLEESERRAKEMAESLSTVSSSLSKVVEELRTQQTLLLEEVRLLRTHEGIKHTNDLLEEIRVLKQRELNLLIREKIPIPFFSSTETLLTKKILL